MCVDDVDGDLMRFVCVLVFWSFILVFSHGFCWGSTNYIIPTACVLEATCSARFEARG